MWEDPGSYASLMVDPVRGSGKTPNLSGTQVHESKMRKYDLIKELI